MASTIKFEIDQISTNSPCHGCLSQDRKLKPLSGEIYKLFYTLLGSGMLYGSEERMILLCWECEAILKRVRKFQNQILQVQSALLELFYNMSPNLQTLSNLSISTKDHYDLFYENIEQTNCSVKVENFKLEPKQNKHSDSEDDFYDKTDYLEISIESTSTDKQNKVPPKKESKEQNVNTKRNEEVSKKNENKKTKVSIKNEKKVKELSTFKKKEYMKCCNVRDIKTEFGINIKKYYSHFKEEVLDLEQIEQYNAKLEQNPCGDRCIECRLDSHSEFLALLRKNLGEIKSESTSSITCLLCKKEMPDLDNLHTHLKKEHCTFWKCTLCNMYFTYDFRFKHISNQHTKAFSCKKCSRDFTSKHHFILHFKKYHDTFVCHHCNKTFKSRFKMIKHQPLHADQNICRICNKIFKNRIYHIKHVRAYHPEVINKETNSEAAYCVECNKQFKTVDLYKYHLSYSVKHNKKPKQSIPCPKCGKVFSKRTYMNNHFNVEHMPENAKHKCTICEKYFTNNFNLKGHYQYVHLKMPKEKNKICDICGQGFHTNRNLANHRLTHTGERPHSCQYCSATFTQRTPMVAHQLKCLLKRKLQ